MITTSENPAEDLIQEQKDIALVMNLARFLGQKTKEGLYRWKHDGLVILVDYQNWKAMASYDDKAVFSTTDASLPFEKGEWWNIVEKVRGRIMDDQKAFEMKRAIDLLRNAGSDPSGN